MAIYEGIESKFVDYELGRAQIGGHTQLLSAHANFSAIFDIAPDAATVMYRSNEPEAPPGDATYDIITGIWFHAVQRKGLLLRRFVECAIQDIAVKDRLVLMGPAGALRIMPSITEELWRPSDLLVK